MSSYTPNKPAHGNPFLNIPSDMDTNPFRWLWQDILSVFRLSRLLPLIFFPVVPFPSGPLDELYPNFRNLRDLSLHAFLIVSQLFLLLSLPVALATFWAFPAVVHLVFYVAFAGVTMTVLWLLNGHPRATCLIGVPKSGLPVNDESELWFYINGIATGTTWLQSNLDLLADTFGREIVGIHNPTKGLILDLVECLIQRDLDYKTRDIRQGRAQLRAALKADSTKKVVLIAHSQGGIEAASIIDWLFGELSNQTMRKLEVYTFGNAARQFRNPPLHEDNGLKDTPSASDPCRQSHGERVIKYIEHYANSEDFVANIGVLKFTSSAAAYAGGTLFSGSVFRREGSGHLLNIHYLDRMFGDDCAFMDSKVAVGESNEEKTVKELSRLFAYKNGKSPDGPDGHS
ncbi:hypothetical protein ASPWEDRAFT_38696 [Aspergillus wentii DTO 134E9]|uniref:DUF676 domain-containing protein n=1 Tax=Aspergillus wentii DTO 134E9 TaxID=1073089 RepID=A0A1L9RQG3_ASPWE|nr:uncharacterized protein ASPWEDRAFT_38696 [Aspergillus wentii DTO 134E9]OJJ37058.1 hypothetical protein ASPWEDRAFT_38696 [Aspergillus wentii DTO 134E9]